MGLLTAPSSLRVVNGPVVGSFSTPTILFPSGLPINMPPQSYLFYPAWGQYRAPSPENLPPLRFERNLGTLKQRFLSLAEIPWTSRRQIPSPSKALEGEMIQVGRLSFSYLSASEFLKAFHPDHVLYPWPRPVDILLVGGFMEHEAFEQALGIYLQLPSPWALFYQSEQHQMQAFKGTHHRHTFLGIDIRKSCEFQVALDVGESDDHHHRASVRSSLMIPFEEKIDRRRPIAKILFLQHAGEVLREMEDLRPETARTSESRKEAHDAVVAAVETVAQYLTYMEGAHGKDSEELSRALELCWGDLDRRDSANLTLSAFAFERLLDLSFKRGVISDHPYR